MPQSRRFTEQIVGNLLVLSRLLCKDRSGHEVRTTCQRGISKTVPLCHETTQVVTKLQVARKSSHVVPPAEPAEPNVRSHQVDEQVTLIDLMPTAVGFVVVIGIALLQ